MGAKNLLKVLLGLESGKGGDSGRRVGDIDLSSWEFDKFVLRGEPGKVVGRNVNCLGVLGRRVQRVPEVVQERVALPSEACLDVRIRHPLTMQEIARRYTNGMR